MRLETRKAQTRLVQLESRDFVTDEFGCFRNFGPDDFS